MPLSDHKRNFNRWKKNLPSKTSNLVEQVLIKIVPVFERHGYVWYSDFAGGDHNQVGSNQIPLQKRSGEEWPTVSIWFNGDRHPRFRIHFSVLPEHCRRLRADGFDWIPREKATVLEGAASFTLLRANVSKPYLDDDVFGFSYYANLAPARLHKLVHFYFSPIKYFSLEVDAALIQVQKLISVLEQPIPREWIEHDRGLVTEFIRLNSSWHWQDRIRAKSDFRE